MPTSVEHELIHQQTPIPTSLGSQDLRTAWSDRVKQEALFSARVTSKTYLDMIKKRLMEVAARETNPQLAERSLQRCLEELGYNPATGFPRSGGKVPPATPKSITDLSSSPRIQLIIDTNVKKARSMGQMAAGESPVFMRTNPAWKLERTGARKKPRGDWKKRWQAAGASVGWKYASQRSFVALKTSPIWEALGKGTGGFEDALGSPFPPFAFGSGMAWTNVGRREWESICKTEGIDSGLKELLSSLRPSRAPVAPSEEKNTPTSLKSPLSAAQVAALKEIQQKIQASRQGLTDDYKAVLRKAMELKRQRAKKAAEMPLAKINNVILTIGQRRAYIDNIVSAFIKSAKSKFKDKDDAAWLDLYANIFNALNEDYAQLLDYARGKRRAVDDYLRKDIPDDYEAYLRKEDEAAKAFLGEADRIADTVSRTYSQMKDKLNRALELAKEAEEKRKKEESQGRTLTVKEEQEKVAEPTRKFMEKIGINVKSDKPLPIIDTNPKFSESEEYRNNCQRCVPAYEARSRGYDVVALSSAGDKQKGALNLAYNSTAMWKNQDKVYLPAKTFKQEVEQKMAEWGDGARAEVRVKWKKSRWGHVFMAIQENGKTLFVDPQNPSADVASYFGKMSTRGRWSQPWILRVDNNEFTEEAKRCFVKR